MTDDKKPKVARLVLISAAITLLVTLVRYYGERQDWDESLFNKQFAAPSWFGIAWLVIPVGFLLGRALVQRGFPPKNRVRAAVLCALGFIAAGGLYQVIASTMEYSHMRLWLVTVIAVACGFAAYFAWPAAWMVLVVYGFLARIPVIVVQYVAISKEQNVHFRKGPPDMPPEDAMLFLTVAQLTFWPLCYTVLVGGLCAALGSMTARKH